MPLFNTVYRVIGDTFREKWFYERGKMRKMEINIVNMIHHSIKMLSMIIKTIIKIVFTRSYWKYVLSLQWLFKNNGA